MSADTAGKIYLVGAGPGNPGLLTCRAVEVLRRADVVLYDRLVDERILGYAKDAQLVYAGKRPDCHTMPQEQINELLVERARGGARVVRLKGGDPFVFGRGGEEALAAREAGLRFEVVPGITSALAVPAYAGIPVTHRGLAAGVTIVTGHEDPGKPGSQVDWGRLAAGNETLVIMMGMGRLAEIAQALLENGRGADTPVAVIENGTQPGQRSLTAPLGELAERVGSLGLVSPAIVVVGAVAALGEQLAWLPARPLCGRRVVVTRARAQASELSSMLRDYGAEPVELPTIEILPPKDLTALDTAIGAIAQYDTIVFTSVNGVAAFFDRLRVHHRKDARSLAKAEVWAIGPKTAEALEARGIVAEFVPREFRAEALLDACAGDDLGGRRFLLPRADIARAELRDGLAARGARIDEVSAYRTVGVAQHRVAVLRLLAEGRLDAVTFTSSSTVRNFVEQFSAGEVARIRDQAVIASIGPITSETARELGLPPTVEAAEYTLEGLLAALVNYFENASAGRERIEKPQDGRAADHSNPQGERRA